MNLAVNQSASQIGQRKNSDFISVDSFHSKTHVSDTKVKNIINLVQTKIYSNIAEKASADSFKTDIRNLDKPLIRESIASINISSKALLAVLECQSLTAKMGESIRKNSSIISEAFKSTDINKAMAMSSDIEKLQNQVDAQFKEASQLVEEHSKAVTELNDSKSKLDYAQKVLDNLLADPNATEAEKIIAKTQLNGASSIYFLCKRNSDKLESETKIAMDKGQVLLEQLNSKTGVMNTKYGSLLFTDGSNARTAVEHSKKALTSTAIMIKLISEFIMKLDENASEKLKNDLKINEIQAKGRQAEMKRKSDEYEEQVRKAEEAQAMAGCIGKILGGLAIAFGAITTIFGGAGTALMAVGIALMVVDPIVEAIAGESLTGMIMNPIMEHVLMPLMDVIGDIVSKIFDYTPLGLLLNAIDKATGANMMDTVHTVVTAVVAIAAIIAVAFVAKSAAKFITEKLTQAMTSAVIQAIKKTIADVIAKIVPQLVRNAAKQSGAALGQTAQAVAKQISQLTDEIAKALDGVSAKITKNITSVIKDSHSGVIKNLQKINLNHLNMARVATDTSNGITQSAMNINIANIQLKASEALSQFQLANADLKILSDMLSDIISNFKDDQNQVQSVSTLMSGMLADINSTGKQVVRNFRV